MNPHCGGNPCPGQVTGNSAMLFQQLVKTVYAAQCNLANPNDYPPDGSSRIHNNDVFDFIVVGAGSAGSVVARRLSENPKWRILLIEAGGNPTSDSDVPRLFTTLMRGPLDWNYTTTPDGNSCLGKVGQSCYQPRGKCLGGTSSINAMFYVRGNPEDYNEWERDGNPGWNYENVLPYFKKSEKLAKHLYGGEKGFSEKYHSTEGLLGVGLYGRTPEFDYLRKLIFEAGEEVKLATLREINGPTQIGLTNSQATIYKGIRSNTGREFLPKNSKNLIVAKNSLAQKIIIKNGRAVGVVVKIRRRILNVYSSKEVILSAGAISSPQILLLSGIGPESHLKEMNIPVHLDLPGVGHNLQDHLMVLGSVFKANPQKHPPTDMVLNVPEYLLYNDGPLASIGASSTIGFVNTLNGGEVPDIQLQLGYGFSAPNLDSYFLNFGYTPEIASQLGRVGESNDLLFLIPALLKPKSKGRISLKTTNPADSPVIYFNYLSEKEDVDTLIRGMRFVLAWSQASALKPLNPEFIELDLPNCRNKAPKSDEWLECFIRHIATTYYHPVGTCKMGPKNDPEAVVDPRLRVHGIERLRVVDASIMPKVPRGNTNAPSIMVGEKASDMILEDWN